MISYIKKVLRESKITREIYIKTAEAIKSTPIFYMNSSRYYKSLNPKGYNADLFKRKKAEALQTYEVMKREKDELASTIGNYTHPVWEKSLALFESFLHSTKFDEYFLRNKLLRSFVSLNQPLDRHRGYMRHLSEERCAANTRNTFKESRVGGPKIIRFGEFLIKPDSIDHLYYLSRLMEYAEEMKMGKVESIIEFGGGYGNMGYCARLLNTEITYTIIDFPEMLTLAYTHNAINFPEMKIHICDGKNGVRKKHLNLLPIGLLPTMKETHQAFISTYALTETPRNVIRYVKEKRFLGAKIVYIQGGMDPIFNSHDALLENISEAIESPRREDHADKSAYELMGTVRRG